MTINPTTLDSALKEIYDDGVEIQNLVYDEEHRSFMSDLEKNTSFEGDKMPFPVIYEDVGGHSAAFATAQTNIAASQIGAFMIDVVESHTVARITTQAIMRSRSKAGSFVEGLKHMVDSAINRHANSIEHQLFRSASGELDSIGSIASDVITLTNDEAVTAFWVGQVLVFAANAASALRDTGTTATVTAVDRSAGTVTIDATPTGVTAGDLIFNEGDYTAANDVLLISGLDDWLPSSAPTTSLFGQARTADPTRLGGVRVTGSASDIEGSIVEGSTKLFRESNGKPNRAYVSPITFGKSSQGDGGQSGAAPGREGDRWIPRGRGLGLQRPDSSPSVGHVPRRPNLVARYEHAQARFDGRVRADR